jgi:superfamily II DNA or RNA helicase
MINNLPAGFDKNDDPDLLVDMDGGGPGQKSEFRKMCELAASHEFNQKIVETYQVWAIDRKATLVFCANLAYVESLTDAFKTAGIETRAVDGSTAKEERSETVEAFKNGEFPVLVNCKVFLEGADLPRVRQGETTVGADNPDRLHRSSQTYQQREYIQSNGKSLQS